MRANWTADERARFDRIYREIFDASDAIARRIRMNPEDFRDGLHDVVKIAHQSKHFRMPSRDRFLQWVIGRGWRYAAKARRCVALDEEMTEGLVAPTETDAVRDERLTAAKYWLTPDASLPAELRIVAEAFCTSDSQREAAEELGLSLRTFQRRLDATWAWMCDHEPAFSEI